MAIGYPSDSSDIKIIKMYISNIQKYIFITVRLVRFSRETSKLNTLTNELFLTV